MMCPICGGPMKPYPYPGEESQFMWLTKAIVFHFMNDQDHDSEILELPTSIEGGPCFPIEDGQMVAILEGVRLDDKNPSLYIPIHEVCNTIAKATIDAKKRVENGDINFWHIWRVPKKQFQSLTEEDDRKYLSVPLTTLFNTNKYRNIEEHQEFE